MKITKEEYIDLCKRGDGICIFCGSRCVGIDSNAAGVECDYCGAYTAYGTMKFRNCGITIVRGDKD